MGGSKGGGQGSTTGSSSQTTTVTPTPEEQELNKLYLEREKFLDPDIRKTQQAGLGLSQQLLQGGSLPGYLSALPKGIDEGVTQSIVQQSLRDIAPGFQRSGLIDSGVAASIGARTAGDIRRNVAEFNLGNLQNLLSQGLGGQAQVQQPITAFSSLLSNRLQGLRSQSSTGTYQQQVGQPSFFNRLLGSLNVAAKTPFGEAGFTGAGFR